jgi:hypothetical protein
MNLVFGFAPFILFFLLSRLSADLALWAAFAGAFVVTIRDFVESPSLRLLDVGNLAVFGLLALVRGFLFPALSLAAVRFAVELALLLLLAASLVRRQPFSLQYVRLHPGESWPPDLYQRVNFLTSTVWTIAFAAMTCADAAAAFIPGMPIYPAIAIGTAALVIAVTFTLRYPAIAAARLLRGV